MNKNPEKKGVRIPSQALLWILSIALGLTACGGRGGGDNAAVLDTTPVPPPKLVAPIPEGTMEPTEVVPPAISSARTKPAPNISATPTG